MSSIQAASTRGFAVVRQFEVELKEMIDEREAGEVFLITGTAGSGKSITIMRLALALQAEGLEVAWIDMQNELPLYETRRLIAEAAPQVVAIDGVDSLGEHTAGFLRELVEAHPDVLFLGSSRSTRFVQLRLQERLRELPFRQFTVPNLEDSDIELLISALHAARRLGRLQGLTHAEQVEAFREQAGRQLLVAMVQATSGERFDEKIDRECSELTPDTALAYAVVAIATNMRESMSRDEVLLALGEPSNVGLAAVDELVRQHLLLRDDDANLRTRHRYIADRVVEHFKRDARLARPMQGVLFALASKARPGANRRSRDKRFLIKLLNHDMWLRQVDVPAARAAYENVEPALHWDAHFWLQRGSLEVEIGDLSPAENFLNQARGLAPDDPWIETEWAYMNLKRAAKEANAVGSMERATAALEALDDAIQQRGATDPYPFHILGSQGLSWVRRAPLLRDQKIAFLGHMREVMRKGMSWHPYNQQVADLARDVETEYLGMAVVQPPPG